MALRFDELESERERRRNEREYLPGLLQMYAQQRVPLPRPEPGPPEPWMRRPGSLRPLGPYRAPTTDPTEDTFEQRFNPRAPSGEKPQPVLPGTRERFLDPTKVIADASGAIPQSGKKSDEQPYAVELPPGFSLEPPKERTTELPPGFSLEPPKNLPGPTAGALAPEPGTPPNAPAPMAGMSQWSPDEAEQAREVAALRTRRSVQPPGGRQEGAFTEAVEGIPSAVGNEAVRIMEIMDRAVKTGDIPPNEALEIGLMATPASAAYKTGMGIARAKMSPQEVAQLETGVTSIPRAATGSETVQTTGRAISGLPFVGSPLRNRAGEATEQLQRAGTAAAARPTGAVVDQKVAGSRVRDGLVAVGPALPPKLQGLLKKSDEDIIGSIITMAGSKGGADIATLAQLRRAVPTRAQPEVQSALIDRLGRGSTGEFDPKAWLRNYGNLSDRGKNVLFGMSNNSLRIHLDAIESVSRRAPTWQQFSSSRSALGTAAGVVGATVAPLNALASVVPLALISRGLSRPAVAAPLAQWSRAYERVARSGGAPQALALFNIATRNLANSMGIDFSVTDFITKASKTLGLDQPEKLPSRLGYPEKGIVPYTLTDPVVDYRKILGIGE